MSDDLKFYTNKPKKAQLKHSTASMGTPPPPPPSSAPPPPPPQSPKESFARRYKFVWPVLLTVNLALGAYLFMRTKKKDPDLEGGEASVDVPSTPTASTITVPEKISPTPPIVEPVNVRESIPENQQRDLFKWVLEEKRKIKPKSPEERKRIDEEKAILKQFIRAKSIPTI